MVAAPQYGTMTIVAGGATKQIELYISDVNAAMVNFDGGGGAGTTSPDYFIMPVAGAIVDFAIKTGLTDTEKVRILLDGMDVGYTVRYIQFLDSLAKHPSVLVPVRAGRAIRLKQVSD